VTPLPLSAWTLEEASAFTNALHQKLQPHYCVGLTGSVLYRGKGKYDLDVIVFPSKSQHWSFEELYSLLKAAGMQQLRDVTAVRREWARKYGSHDRKHVEIWQTAEGKRVDLFFLR